MIVLSKIITKLAQSSIWQDKIQERFGITCSPREPGEILDPIVLRQTYLTLDKMSPELVKDCGVSQLYFSSTMGPNKPYYPNHGYYVNNSVTLNIDIFYHPDVMDDFFDHHGYFIDRPTQTVLHEFAHGYDAAQGDLSLKSDWTSLSGWSPDAKPGLKRLIINQPGTPQVIGEWFYDPSAGFTRFYAKRNPWDDWADAFSFYIGDMKSKLPENKIGYFDNLLKKYKGRL